MSVSTWPDPATKRLRFHLNTFTITGLPRWSAAPTGSPEDLYSAVRDAGYTGVQHAAPITAAREAGLAMTGYGRILLAHDALGIAQHHRDAGFLATTIHLGHGLESEAEADRLVEALLEASVQAGYPLYIETHRATLTQDMWRTLRLIERFPEIRFNADLSHWYAGLEMPYGDFDAKLMALQPVFDRVRYLHGRVANSAALQVPVVAKGPDVPHIAHFHDMWARCARGFLDNAAPHEELIFAPELLPAILDVDGERVVVNYARLDANGEEETDRWAQALLLCGLAADAFATATRSVSVSPLRQ